MSNAQQLLQTFIEDHEMALKVRQSLTLETDRGAVLVSAAFLDLQLKNMLTAGFIENTEIADRLLGTGDRSPIGTFSSRIDLCYALGHISAEQRRLLHLVRSARNHCAHGAEPVRFDDSQIRNRVQQMVRTGLPADAVREVFLEEVRKLLSALLLRTRSTTHAVSRQPDPIEAVETSAESVELVKKATLAVAERLGQDVLDKFMQPGADENLKKAVFTLVVIEVASLSDNLTPELRAAQGPLMQLLSKSRS